MLQGGNPKKNNNNDNKNVFAKLEISVQKSLAVEVIFTPNHTRLEINPYFGLQPESYATKWTRGSTISSAAAQQNGLRDEQDAFTETCSAFPWVLRFFSPHF